ncbi:MAG TPA: DinB family protein [Chryseolinea sp.]
MTSNDLFVKLRRDVLSIIDAAKDFERLPESDLNWKEHQAKWSILECLEHLNRYSLYYNAEFKKAIDRAVAINNNQHQAKSTWMGRKFIAMMHPDNTTKHKTFARMNPTEGSLKKEVIGRFLRNQRELLNILDLASKVDLNKASISVEFLKILKMNLGDALQFVIVHEQRHLKQAVAVRSNVETLLTPALRI